MKTACTLPSNFRFARRATVLVLIYVGLSVPAGATEEVFYGGLYRTELLASTPAFEVSDTFPGSVDQTVSVRNLIYFTVDEDTLVKSSAFVHWVLVNIDKYDANNNYIGTDSNIRFYGRFDPAEGARYDYGHVYEFRDVHRFKVTVTAKSGSFPAHFRLEGKIIIDRKYNFSCSASPALIQKTHAQLYDATTNALQVGWEKQAGAEEYDLEWAFYDTLGATIGLAAGSYDDFDFLFRNNATRITTAHSWYKIPLVYPQGRIYWRVRGVRYKNNQREQGRWTSVRPTTDTLVLGKDWYWVAWHEPDLNWQMQLVYAEEGKRSQSATYFDGSLRNRQKVIRSDAIDMVVASEVIYDSLGRAALQVMPAPVCTDTGYDDWTRKIRYVDAYSAAPGKAHYSAVDFNFAAANCTVASTNPASQMDSSASVVARYYSSANPWRDRIINKFTPAADGYPFSLTEFMPDPTGRIRRQGGVGPAFQLGSGHETKYFYAKPDQDELDRLFGNEVGLAAHYQKNAVADPNGQISVSYIDAHGRTIATALAGASPDSLQQLDNFSAADQVKKDLLNNVRDGLALVSTYSLLVTSVGPDTFTYAFEPPLQLSIDSCLAEARCYDCKYDVEISVLSECGEQMINGGSLFTWNNYPTFDLTCEALPDTLVQTFIETLPVGVYQVRKTIRVSETALNFYADDFLANLTCLPDPDSLKKVFIGDTLCRVSCEDCFTQLGSWSNFLTAYVQDIPSPVGSDTLDAQNAFQTAYASCLELCDESDPSDCQVMYELMLLDVSPGGQYADYGELLLGPGPDSTFVYTASGDTTSVFWKAAGAERYPYQDTLNIGLYYDEIGNVDYVTLPDSIPVRVDYLGVNEFITYFKPSWAKTLVKAHPEYCAWLCCTEMSDPYFDSLLTSTSSYAQAVANGFIPIDSLIARDSFFVYNPELIGTMDTIWSLYTTTHTSQCSEPVSLTEIIKSIVFCGGVLPCDIVIDTLCTADNDLYWQLIVSHYLSERNRLKWQKIRSGACPAPAMPNDYCTTYDSLCFGYPTCYGQPNPYRDKVSRLFASPAPPLSVAVAEDSIHILIQYVNEQLENACDSTCAAMAGIWIESLSLSCDSIANAGQTRLDELRDRFIAVCKNGCDLEHPFGSITTAGDSTTYGDYTLQDAIEGVFPSLDSCDTACSAKLIDFPGTYSIKQYTVPPQQIYYRDTCRCNRLEDLENCWEAVSDSTTFLEYLNSLSNVPLTEAALLELQNGCDTACTFMSGAITIPPILECGTCKTLAELKPKWNAFKSSGCIGGTVDADEENLMAGYMNQLFGLNRTYEDYTMFIDTGLQSDSTCRYLCPLSLFPESQLDTSCVSVELDEGMEALANLTYQNLLDSMRRVFVRNYLAKCLGPDLVETFCVSMPQGEYHYTLYYYDQADNLVRTVPPKGVNPLTSPSNLQAVKAHRANSANPPEYPEHSFNTRYWYNTLNQVVRDSTPDRGVTEYWYDQLGRLVLSQNAEQRTYSPTRHYTYSLYDPLGRVVETGRTLHAGTEVPVLGDIWDYADFEDWLLNDGTNAFKEVTKTYYDEAIFHPANPFKNYFPNPGSAAGQDNLRNRVATVTFEEIADSYDTTYNYATHYSYDIAGNVKQLVQDFPELDTVGHRFKRIGYEYDLISGKVNYVYYQRDSIDQFFHHYVYDADNRVEYVETSNNGLLWERDANYEYYLHGPLGRTELGERRVQGLDYAYTLQGWLKGMNASALRLDTAQVGDFATRDMGRDGKSGNSGDMARNITVARDAAAFTLGYYYGEYRKIGTQATDRFEMQYSHGGHFESGAPSLYNGNIRHAVYSIAKLHEQGKYEASPEGYAYRYDQLNRLVKMEAYNSGYSYNSFSWTSGTAASILKENVTYDPNGNILTYDRYGNAGSPAIIMDSLTYHYDSDNNKLNYITDAQTNKTAYQGDLEDQPFYNYSYDEIGNMVFDANSGLLSNIYWTNTQKLKLFTKIGSNSSVEFYYNPMQQRVVKIEQYWINGGIGQTRTYYIRDAQGNVMAAYKWIHNEGDFPLDSLFLTEHHIYGSARVGMALPEIKLYPAVPENPYILDSVFYTLPEGWKRYELTNHLGNVLAVITDRKRGMAASGADIQWYEADIMAAQQYYPFGMLMPTSTDSSLRRQYSLNAYDYRYGFNGKEGDDEIKEGDDNQQDYGMRIYDPRVGRFLSVDPLRSMFPMLSPYLYASNTPIQAIDEDGLYTIFIQGAIAKNSKKKRKKEKNKTFSSDLNREFSQILNKPGQPIRFAFSKTATAPNLIEKGLFTLNNGFKPGISNPDDKELFDMVVAEIIAGYEEAKAVNPEEKINLIGSSYGSVMAAQIALELDSRGYELGSVLLTATPLSEESELGQGLNELKRKGVVILYQYNDNDGSQGVFKTTKKDYLRKNWFKNPIRYIGHLTNMFKKERVDDVMQATLLIGTEGEAARIEAKTRLQERAEERE